MFPYLAILKEAWEYTKKNTWLWAFGIFVSGLSILNAVEVRLPHIHRHSRAVIREATFWLFHHPTALNIIVVSVLVVSFATLFCAGLSRAAIVWSAAQQSEEAKKEINFRLAVAQAMPYAARIMGLQFLVTWVFVVLLLVFSTPVYFLFWAHASWQALSLLFLGIVIFVPAAVVFGFLHLYGPIFIVLYDERINSALALAWDLLRSQFKESVILSAFLIGLEVLVSAAVAFTLTLAGLPIAVLIGLLLGLGLKFVAAGILTAAILAALIYVIVLKAGVAVFQNITWVLAVLQMVKTKRLPEKAEAFASEPAS